MNEWIIDFSITKWRLALDSDWEKSSDNKFQWILVLNDREDPCNVNYHTFHLVQLLNTNIEVMSFYWSQVSVYLKVRLLLFYKSNMKLLVL